MKKAWKIIEKHGVLLVPVPRGCLKVPILSSFPCDVPGTGEAPLYTELQFFLPSCFDHKYELIINYITLYTAIRLIVKHLSFLD